MNVATNKPFSIVYSVYEHEFLGYLIEPYAVQHDQNGKLTLLHQHISSKNANEFKSAMDPKDQRLIRLLDEITQESITHKFSGKRTLKAEEYLPKIYNKQKDNELVISQINSYLENRKTEIFELLVGKKLFEMGSDGEPTWKEVEVCPDKGTVLFHFFRNEDNTHYFPTIKFRGEKTELQHQNAIILNNKPAWLLLNGRVFSFEKEVDGNKLKPFLRKRFIEIPKKLEEEYYTKFVSPLVASFNVHAKGFEIKNETCKPQTSITFSELQTISKVGALTLFGNEEEEEELQGEEKLLFDISFRYGDYHFPADSLLPVSVKLEKNNNTYIFHKVQRDTQEELRILGLLKNLGAKVSNGRFQLEKGEGLYFAQAHAQTFVENKISLRQHNKDEKRYFIGESRISLEINESNDWFDVHAKVYFGMYEIPFLTIRKYLKKGIKQFALPNGEIAVIPAVWQTQYSELFNFLEEQEEGLILKKHHVTLLQNLQEENLAEVVMGRKLQKLKEFESLDEHEVPRTLKGELRHYQKSGYNWMKFLNEFNFGGCLADDMGLGKTIQTLTLLLDQKDLGKGPTLLICPTSLVFNWELEAKKFAPGLSVLNYTGTYRNKNVEVFSQYDLILTSYGTVRVDIDLLKKFYFNYIILDESQAIKNPNSNITQDVSDLVSKNKLVLTGTPIENSTLDLWSQMNFVNPGLLGTQQFFRNHFMVPIEKKKDLDKIKRLHTLVKPFILRRKKSQVATELPEKIEQVVFCEMTEAQEKLYEETKAYYRNQIIDNIENQGMSKSQILIIQGLTKLRQIANHPGMCTEDYSGGSAKFETVLEMHDNALGKEHKILIFSQFVKHLSYYKGEFQQQAMPFTYIDGTTKDRQQQVEAFQKTEDIRTFLISLKAGGTGLNLTAADYVFILDPWWNPAVEQQAIDRAYRIGQKNNVFVYKFITKNTVEEKILQLQQKKMDLAENLISTDDGFVKSLTKEDINSIFS